MAPYPKQPKTYFAAERTFIQWISVSLLPVPRVSAISLMCIAIFVSTYALAIYFRRLHILQNAKQYGYTDHFAPVILTIAVLAGISCIFYYYTIEAENYALETMSVEGDKCDRLDYAGVSKLSFEPSGIAIDRNKNLAYVPSGLSL